MKMALFIIRYENPCVIHIFIMVVSSLNAESPVFSFIQYYLKQCLGASSVQVCEINEISNPQLTIQFEKKSKVTCLLHILFTV